MTSSPAKIRILVVEDELVKRETMEHDLCEQGWAVLSCEDAETAVAHLSECDVLITDVRLPGMDGIELVREAIQTNPQLVIYVMTAFGSVEMAVDAMRAGAQDYLVKPFPNSVLIQKIERTEELLRAQAQLRELQKSLQVRSAFEHIVGQSPALLRALSVLDRAARSDAGVFLLGESGTGKEMFAQALHAASGRNGPIIAVNCAALPDSLLESELFGHEKGAFTGAHQARAGRFEAARAGTLFLDDIDAMPLAVQAKLLRVLQEKTIERLGANRQIPVDVRVVASARPNITDKVSDGTFREDLYYRLNVIPVYLPPLRERLIDLPALTHAFIAEFSPEGRTITLSTQALHQMSRYSWPGNVRQLRNIMQRLCVLAQADLITFDDLPDEVRMPSTDTDTIASLVRSVDKAAVPMSDFLAAAQREYITWALGETAGKVAPAAELLGIPRSTLRDFLKQDQLSETDESSSSQ